MTELLTIRKETSRTTKLVLATAAWVLVVLIWSLITHWELISTYVFPTPMEVLRAFKPLFTERGLLSNVYASWLRIGQAFLWCVVIAVPLGLLMGAFRWVYDLVNPVAEPMRSMPTTAFLPAFIGLFGIDETMKVAFLWFGMFFYLLAVVVEEVNRVDTSLLETAYTLGAKRYQVMWLMFRASIPGIFSSFRILYDIGWTYVILAEIVNRKKGVGAMVQSAYEFHQPDLVYAGIIAIGVAAFVFRFMLTISERVLFPWRQVAQSGSESSVAITGSRGRKKAVSRGE
ncbi:MAG TPA: ABC transporter permease [Candidatus Angelobacter sp.]|jgi:ABC-type nitrate/sulfonate/bicarbonate transport system permease component|nr:ABC transporter permease [Candidatus Angelobacter sp.]